MILDSALTMPRTCVAADWVVTLDTVDSTNTYAANLVREGRIFGGTGSLCPRAQGRIAVVCADEQTAGRGRLDHRWFSAPGESFIVSLAVDLPGAIVRDPSVNGWLQMIAGCETRRAVIDAVRELGGELHADIALKWPNDVFADGRKLGGLLAEMVPLAASDGNMGEWRAGDSASGVANGGWNEADPACAERVAIVIGIGLNLDVPEEHLPVETATSLQLTASGLPDADRVRDAVAAHLIEGLKPRFADFEADSHREAERVLAETTAVCWTLGKRCEAHFVDGSTLRGTAVSLNDDASLTIRDENGGMHVVHTADVGVLAK